MRVYLLLGASLFISTTIGCATNYYQLSPIAVDRGPQSQPDAELVPAVVTTDDSPAISLGIGPVSVSAAAGRQEIVRVDAKGQVTIDNDDRWLAPIDKHLTDTITHNLVALINPIETHRHPWGRKDDVDYQVQVAVLELRGERVARKGKPLLNQSTLVVRWMLRDAAGEVLVAPTQRVYSTPVESWDPEAVSRGISIGLGELSEDIAQQIHEFERPKANVQPSSLERDERGSILQAIERLEADLRSVDDDFSRIRSDLRRLKQKLNGD